MEHFHGLLKCSAVQESTTAAPNNPSLSIHASWKDQGGSKKTRMSANSMEQRITSTSINDELENLGWHNSLLDTRVDTVLYDILNDNVEMDRDSSTTSEQGDVEEVAINTNVGFDYSSEK